MYLMLLDVQITGLKDIFANNKLFPLLVTTLSCYIQKYIDAGVL